MGRSNKKRGRGRERLRKEIKGSKKIENAKQNKGKHWECAAMIQIALGNHYCRKINQLLTFNNGRRDVEQLFTKTTPSQPHSSILQSLSPPHTFAMHKNNRQRGNSIINGRWPMLQNRKYCTARSRLMRGALSQHYR